MSNKVWQRRRTKQGLAARQFASITRQVRRANAAGLKPPLHFVSKGTGIKLELILEPRDETAEGWSDELWDDEPDWGDDPRYDTELGVDQARWRPEHAEA